MLSLELLMEQGLEQEQWLELEQEQGLELDQGLELKYGDLDQVVQRLNFGLDHLLPPEWLIQNRLHCRCGASFSVDDVHEKVANRQRNMEPWLSHLMKTGSYGRYGPTDNIVCFRLGLSCSNHGLFCH